MVQFQPEWLLRLLCSLVMGILLGYERYVRSKEAGIRTHAIVAVAACMIMIVSKYGFGDTEKVDAARLAAQVVSGVGFLGAGLIFVRNDSVHGLTTAAGIWGTSALGLCFGAGMYIVGFFCGFLLLLIEREFRRIFPMNSTRNMMDLRVHIDSEGTLKSVSDSIDALGLGHSANHISSDENGGWYLETKISTHREYEPSEILKELSEVEHVLDVKIL